MWNALKTDCKMVTFLQLINFVMVWLWVFVVLGVGCLSCFVVYELCVVFNVNTV